MHLLKGLKINALLTAIVYLAVGIVFILLPDIVLQYVPLVLAVLMALLGIYYIISYFRRWATDYRSNGLAVGMLLLFGALFFVLQREAILTAIPALLGLAVVVSGTLKLQNAIVLRRSEDSLWLPVLIMAIIFLIVGVLFIVNPFVTTQALVIIIGVTLVVSGVSDLIIIFLMSRHAKAVKKRIDDVIVEAPATVSTEPEPEETPQA